MAADPSSSLSPESTPKRGAGGRRGEETGGVSTAPGRKREEGSLEGQGIPCPPPLQQYTEQVMNQRVGTGASKEKPQMMRRRGLRDWAQELTKGVAQRVDNTPQQRKSLKGKQASEERE